MRVLCVLVAIAAACKMNEKKPPPSPAPEVAKPRSLYCAGTKEWPAGTKTCSDDVACGSAERCYRNGVPDYSGTCGAVPPDQIACNEDRDCKRGQICEQGLGVCGTRVSKCVPGCTATSCADGQRCGKNLRCAAIPCSEGYACGSGTHCGSGFYSDDHGCVTPACWEGGAPCGPLDVCKPNVGCDRSKCKHAADCACGSCVYGMCTERPGVCGPEQLPIPG